MCSACGRQKNGVSTRLKGILILLVLPWMKKLCMDAFGLSTLTLQNSWSWSRFTCPFILFGPTVMWLIRSFSPEGPYNINPNAVRTAKQCFEATRWVGTSRLPCVIQSAQLVCKASAQIDFWRSFSSHVLWMLVFRFLVGLSNMSSAQMQQNFGTDFCCILEPHLFCFTTLLFGTKESTIGGLYWISWFNTTLPPPITP